MKGHGPKAAVKKSASGVILKSPREIELMRAAGSVVQQVLTKMREMARPGVTTGELDATSEKIVLDAGGIALFKGVENPQASFPFPGTLCTSVNEELVHGVPGDRKLEEGDVISVDCGVRLAGYCGDAATTIAVGSIAPESQRLLDVTKRALDLAIGEMRPGRMWSEIATQMQALVEDAGMAVVRDFVGHGIGREMHENPKVPNYWNARQARMDFELVPGLVLAVEPMVNLGGHTVEYGDASRWVIVTRDRKYAAHFEHTLAVTDHGVEVLTAGDKLGR